MPDKSENLGIAGIVVAVVVPAMILIPAFVLIGANSNRWVQLILGEGRIIGVYAFLFALAWWIEKKYRAALNS